MKVKYLLPAIAVASMLSGAAVAQDNQMNWNSLSESQKQVLNPYADDWDSMDIERRGRLAEGAKRCRCWRESRST